jgi:hypothetical protein
MSDNLEKQEAVQSEETFDFVPVEDITEEEIYSAEHPDADQIEEPTEEVEESTEEVVEESEEEAPIKDVPNKENPSRFEYWQSKFTQEQNARKELEDKLQSFEQKMDTFTKPPEPEPLKPPVKPNSDDPLDKIEYLEKLAEYNQTIVLKQQEAFEKQQEAQRQAQAQAQFKAYMLGEYQKVADERLSQEAFNFFSSEDSLDPVTQIEMFQAWKDKSASKQNPKVNQMKTQQAKQKVPLPPGVAGGTTEVPEEMDFGEDLLNFTKKYKV